MREPLAIAAWAITAFAPAEQPPPRFSWDAPAPDCPSEIEVRKHFEERLDETTNGDGLAEVAVVARVRRTAGGGYELRLWTAEAGRLRERTLTDGDCAVLADAAALLVALALHPEAGSSDARVAAVAAAAREEPAPHPPPARDHPGTTTGDDVPSRPTPPTARAGARQSPKRERPRRARTPIQGTATAWVGLALGALPGAGAAVRVSGAISFPLRGTFGLRIAFPLTYEPERRGRFADRPELGANLHLVASGAAVCPEGRWKRVTLPVCAGLEAGAIVGRGVGIDEPKTDAVPWLAVPLSAGLDVGLGHHVVLSLAVEGLFPILRPVFVVTGLGDVFRPAPAAMRLLGGLGARW